MEEHRGTGFDERGLVVGDRALPWWGATVHYWRVPRAAWAPVLLGLRGLGLTLVEVPVPWAIHEAADGRLEWSGDRDLGAFLDAVAAAGLAAVVELGPLAITTETWTALPERIVRDEGLWARSAHGGPAWVPQVPRAFPLPSLASTRFAAEVERFHRAVAAIVGPRCPAPVVAIGFDPGLAGRVRGGAFDLDYHPDAIAAWRQRHDQDPPRAWDPSDPATAIEWLRQPWWDDAAARWSAALTAAGVPAVARVGAIAPGDPRDDEGSTRWPLRVDLAHGTTPRVALSQRLAGGRGTPLVRLPAGSSPLFTPTTVAERGDLARAALAHGARGATWTMGVAIDRWIGGLVTVDGAPTADGRQVASLVATAERIGVTTLQRQVDVALVMSRADARWARATSLVAPLPPAALELVQLGPAGAAELSTDVAAGRARRWFDAVRAALELGQVAFAIVDERAELARLPARAFVAPTLARVDRALWRQLQALAAERRVVVVGPDTPTADELGEPLDADAALPRRAGMMRAGSLDDLPGLADDLAGLAPRDEWIATRPAGVSTTCFRTADGHVRALFVTNASDRQVRAVVAVPAAARLADAVSGAAIAVTDGHAAIELAAHATRWLTVG